MINRKEGVMTMAAFGATPIGSIEDSVGIIVELSECIASRGGSILNVDVCVPENKSVFYSRGEFIYNPAKWPREQINKDFHKLAMEFNAMRSVVRVPDIDPKYKIVVLASKQIIDGVAGDLTVTFNRTSFVDFTLPYTESGVTMLVSNKQRKSMWVVVKPLSWDLWLAIVIVSIFIGLVQVILERHNTNNSTTASPKRFVGTLFWLPMASAISSQGDKVINSYSKFVLVVWLFLAFVLMQSYSASLSSMLTVDQLLPTYTSVDQLRKGGYFIGYQQDSFVGSLLTHKLGFSPSKLIPYGTIDEYHDALSKGSKNGGVAAIFDEIPYIRMFLGQQSSDFMMAGLTYRTGGFGFAFHLNSTLVPHFSRAILNISDGNNLMDELETEYFGHTLVPSNYQSTLTNENSSPLTVYNFGGLFICVGFATLLTLLVSESYIWRVPVGKAKQFSQRIYFSFSSSNKTQIANDPTEVVDGNLELPDINYRDISIELQDHVRI